MKTKMMLTAAIAALTFAGCQASTDTPSVQSETPEKISSEPLKLAGAEDIGNRGDVMMAVQNQARSDKDKADDASRKPAEVLQFTGIRAGMTVLELEAGSGYYTELLSYVVGPNGKVIMQNPPAFDAFLKPEVLDTRLGADGSRLANVDRLKTNFDKLDAVPDASVDTVTWFLGPHELFYTPKGSDGLGDADVAYAEIHRVLKPGGRFIALDHAAALDADESTGGDTHRISPARVDFRAKTAGLVKMRESKALRNSEDDYSKNVFDPSVRRKTDRFLHMYIKPE